MQELLLNMKDTAKRGESMGPVTPFNPMSLTNPNAKIHYNGKNVILLAFTGSLGGLSVGYNCGIVAGACLYMDQVFSEVTLADKSVRHQIIYTIERRKHSGVWSYNRRVLRRKLYRFLRKKEDNPTLWYPHNNWAADSVPRFNCVNDLFRESDSGVGHGHLNDVKSGIPLWTISLSAQRADLPHILLRMLYWLHFGASVINRVCIWPPRDAWPRALTQPSPIHIDDSDIDWISSVSWIAQQVRRVQERSGIIL